MNGFILHQFNINRLFRSHCEFTRLLLFFLDAFLCRIVDKTLSVFLSSLEFQTNDLNAGTTWERRKNLSSRMHHFAACYTTKKFGARKSLLSQPACVCTWQRVAKEGGRVTHVANSISSPLFSFFSATFSHPHFRLRLPSVLRTHSNVVESEETTIQPKSRYKKIRQTWNQLFINFHGI